MAPDEKPTVRSLRSTSPEATSALAAALGARLAPGSVLALVGEMGAGKTSFVRGLAVGLGVTDPVSSPTFTLMHRYEGRVPLHHFDAWMEGRERAFLSDGGAEWLGEEGVSAIEWAERIADWLPLPHLSLELRHAGPRERRILLRVAGDGPAAEALERLVRELALPPGVEEER